MSENVINASAVYLGFSDSELNTSLRPQVVMVTKALLGICCAVKGGGEQWLIRMR